MRVHIITKSRWLDTVQRWFLFPCAQLSFAISHSRKIRDGREKQVATWFCFSKTEQWWFWLKLIKCTIAQWFIITFPKTGSQLFWCSIQNMIQLVCLFRICLAICIIFLFVLILSLACKKIVDLAFKHKFPRRKNWKIFTQFWNASKTENIGTCLNC